MRTVYLDGHFMPEAQAKLSIYDLSVMQAAAAFEMTRSFNGVHFKLRAHLERLLASCQALSIPFEWSLDEVERWCHETANQNYHGLGEEHRLLIVVSPGCAPMYRELEGVIPHPFLYIADFPLRYTVKGMSRYFTEGVHCVTSTVQQVPDACVPSSAKHRSRLHFHLAQQQAPPETWPLMLNAEGYYTEAPGANIVYAWNTVLFHIESHALPGISMQTVQALAGSRPGSLPPTCLHLCEELWLTGTPFCMLPVVSLDGRPIGDGRIGPRFKETMARWNDLVGVDIQRQMEDWDRC